MKILWQISKGLLKGGWQLIRVVIAIAGIVLDEMPETRKKHKLYTAREAHDLFYQEKISVAEYVDCTEEE